MKKRIISISIIIIIIIGVVFPCYADDTEEEQLGEEELEQELIQASTPVSKNPNIESRAAVVLDRTSKRVLWGKEENTKRAMASTTKIMTCLVVLEKAKLTDVVEISKKAGSTGGSRLGLKAKDKITVHDLLYGLMLRSGNDSAVALAEHVGGSVQGFAELMNQKARELGLCNTHFITPHGLDEIEHYTTAYELACIADVALNNKKFAQIVNTKTTTIMINNSPKILNNTNELLGNLNGVDGIKTGFTNNAGRCLVTSTTRNGHQIICVILGADTKKIRTRDSIKLIEYAFSNYEYVQTKELIQEKFIEWKQNHQKKLRIDKGKGDIPDIQIESLAIEEIPILKEEVKDIQVTINAISSLKAPIEKGKVIGKIQIINQKEVFLETNIVIQNTITKKQVKDYFWDFLLHYQRYFEKGLKNVI